MLAGRACILCVGGGGHTLADRKRMVFAVRLAS